MPGRKRTYVFVGVIGMVLGCIIGTGSIEASEKLQVIPAETPEMLDFRKAVEHEIEGLSLRMIEMSDWMYHNPEPAFLEFEASTMLRDELKKNGFDVVMGVPGLDSEFDRLKIAGGLAPDFSGPSGIPTGFKAKYKGKDEYPVIGIVVEYDALRGNPPFHGCQHNMQGPTGIGAGVALARIMDRNQIPGSVWIIGAPAEEVGPSVKGTMAKTGYFDGIDFILRSHGTERGGTLRNPGGFTERHIRQVKYTFHGKSAHAQWPWEGASALDALLLLFHSIDMMREHSEPQFRFHGIVSDGGVAPNIVPELASGMFWIRHLIDATPVGTMSPRKAREMIEKKVADLDNMAKAAALATKTTVDIDHYGETVPGISVGILNDIAFQYAVDYGGVNTGARDVPIHWDDSGYGSIAVPGVWINFDTGEIPIAPVHSQQYADLSITPEGHRSLILVSKIMAAVALRLVMDTGLQEEARTEHAMWVKKYNE